MKPRRKPQRLLYRGGITNDESRQAHRRDSVLSA